MLQRIYTTILLYALFCIGNTCLAQQASVRSTGNIKDAFTPPHYFISNIGQYGDTIKGFASMGKILFGYEGLDMPVLFTTKGIIHLQRKITPLSTAEKEKAEKQGLKEEDIEQARNVTDRTISMEFIGANPHADFVTEDRSAAYHTYGKLQQKAYGYERLICKDVYPGIDIIYSFTNAAGPGFEYSIVINPGADISLIKLRYGGDVTNINQDAQGNLLIRSDINGIAITHPVAYYGRDVLKTSIGKLRAVYNINGHEISFRFPEGYDRSSPLVIDPFVTATGNLAGLNAGKAKDVDFDYAGNIYVTGGGDGNTHQLAKYNAAGVLQWTFNGTLTIPSWNFGSYWGGWMVEKPTGNVYLGQGFNPITGFQVIRVSTTGLYDNFITNANANFREAWKMLWSCNNGSPQILVAGGGTNSNINFGVFTPPSTAISSLNVTGIPYSVSAGWAQDIVDFIIDPSNNDMYTIYGSLIGNPSLTNKIYKNTAPYSGTSVAWNVPSGFISVQEIANRPYLLGGQIDNSANIFAINNSYLYYWDGKNLKAFDKATGNGVGSPLITANAKLMQGGIIADACNNVFVGEAGGLVKVYKFNGTAFDDAAAPDITIPGFAGRSVYDLAYDESKKLLYASGDGFVSSVDVSAYCPSTKYTLTVIPDCSVAGATVSISPAPPVGSVINYVLSIGGTQVASNTTGVFTGLSPNTTYTILATINLSCSGIQATTTFVLPGPVITFSQVNTTCGSNTGSITASGSGTAGPYTYSLDGVTFQPSGTFNGLAAGIYTLTVKDAGGCKNTKVITILNANGPVLTFSTTNADCGNTNGSVTATATGGTPPFQYSLNAAPYQGSNFFTGLTGGSYTLAVKDAAGCINSAVVLITSTPGPQLTAIPASATCGSNNGTVTAFGSGGTPPLLYSINGNTFQPGNVFSNLTPGPYTVTVKDANGCIKTTTVSIANAPSPTVTATATVAACNNVNGTVTASGTGGIAPLQYSINGGVFQSSNIFTGLGAGTYTITVKDATGCTNLTSVTVTSTGGPAVTASTVASGCAAASGSVTITATGLAPFQYSINGITFQASNIFNGIAAGTYIVLAKDANGCIGSATVVVSNTAGPTISAVPTPTSCSINNGVITISSTGGTTPYQYSLDGTLYQPGNVFSGLGAGNYTAYVKDANGCIKTTAVSITNSSGLTLALSTITASCSGNNGIITATANGGIAPLQYSINGTVYQASNVFSGLTPGNYTVYVKDANGCIVSKSGVVGSVAGPSINVNILNATCSSSSGAITVIVTGGLAPITYNLDGGAFQPGNSFVNVTPGTHTVSVKDAAGCIATQTGITITNSGAGTAPTDVTFTIRDILACTGGTGRIKNLKGVPSGGGNNYTFSLDFGAFTTANQFFNVSVGTHTITAKNQNGCTVTRTATLGNGVPATATATATATACNTSNGTITITGVGANTPYHASIDNGATWITFFPPGINSQTFTGLAPGTYPIIIADDADFTTGPPDIPGACLTTINVVVPSLAGPSLSTTQVNGSCAGNNGSITATGSAGTPPYTYSINGGTYFTSGTFNNLGPGTYAISVKDATGCTNGTMVTLTNPGVPAVTAVIQDVSCNTNNGSITASGSGGTAPLEYSINGTTFQAGNIFSNLAPGNYTLYVKDANGCYSTLAVTIANIPLPNVTAYTVSTSCNINDGSIVASGSGGITPYVFSIDGTAYQSSNIFAGLGAGFYTVYIKDSRGCITSTGVTVTNIGAPVFTSTSIAATCGNSNGSVSINASGGTAPYSYSINGSTFQPGNTFTALAGGSYIITVKDALGCISSRAVLVANTAGPASLTATITDASCDLNNGGITASASGGTAPLQYSIDGITYQPGTSFNNLGAGNYTLYVKDANGCTKSLPVSIINLAGPSLTATSTPASCGSHDGTITATATGGTGLISYSLNGTTFQPGNTFSGLTAGSYTITAKDEKGCTGVTTVTVGSAGANLVPTFTPIPPICAGTTLAPLPLTSIEGITGTWSPALNNLVTTTYTFSPSAGQCAATTTLTITVKPKPSPIIIYHN